jgi:trk system potassium uptake protein TrkA
MKTKMQIGIIGLGKFGLKVGQTLTGLGHEVMGIDQSEKRVKDAQHDMQRVYMLDATNKEALEQVRIQDMEYVLVSVGESIAVSAMVVMYLKELGVKNVFAKAIHSDHEKLLHKIGVTEVIIPEYMAANHLANRIAKPGFVEYLPFDKSMALKEFKVSRWAGKTLRQIDVTNTHGVQIIALKPAGEEHYRFIPRADDKLAEGDCMVILGDMDILLNLKP